jgi:hypothetical protein
MPPTVSPSPSRSARPRRISGPISTRAMFLTKMGVPFMVLPDDDFSRSSLFLAYPRPRTMYSVPENSTRRPAHVVVARANGVHHFHERDLVGRQGVGVHVHLILFLKTADGGHFGHPGHRLEPVAQIPILKTPQLRQDRSAPFCPRARIDTPTPPRWRPVPVRFLLLSEAPT